MSWTDPARYFRYLRMGVVLVTGGTVVLVGLLMVFTPGPAIIVVPAGIAILATEFAWARRLLVSAKAEISRRMGRRPAQTPPPIEPPPAEPPPG